MLIYRFIGLLAQAGADLSVYRFIGLLAQAGADLSVYRFIGLLAQAGADLSVYRFIGAGRKKPAVPPRCKVSFVYFHIFYCVLIVKYDYISYTWCALKKTI